MAGQTPARALLCRPHGGLNDALCRISECLAYARRFNRHLVIDTRHCSLFGPFGGYFAFTRDEPAVSPSLTPALCDWLNSMTCRPRCLEGRVEPSEAITRPGAGNVMDSRTGQSVRFAEAGTPEFEQDYREALLVHEGHGGGTTSADLLPLLRLSSSIRDTVRTATMSLPAAYSAIHIRNTDLRTDHRPLLKEVERRATTGAILVCSDDPSVIDRARRMMPERAIAFADRSRSHDRAGTLHKRTSHLNAAARHQAAIDALTDLIALGNAREIFCAHTMAQRLSGFSFLACHLCANKGVIDALMGVPEPERRPPNPHAAIVIDVNGGWRHRLWQAKNRFSRAMARARCFNGRWRAVSW